MWLSHVSVYVSSSRTSAGSACPRSWSDRRRLALQLDRGASNQPSGWEDKGAAGCTRRCHVTWRKLESASLVEVKSPRKRLTGFRLATCFCMLRNISIVLSYCHYLGLALARRMISRSHHCGHSWNPSNTRDNVLCLTN
ncbi:hypothetical protein GQ607_016060 [Colletotrichum asianum]|uniref:Uncharacterized protein n=1 Tax=Colletotrichum asianum TaxID=702518 RepID=A0A8H3ZF15_9PEZI|nr:hypothetical protein GQ607_016060 [Colletotrichum asianum]